MKKQTAVEWLIEQMNWDFCYDSTQKIIDQAKAIEKEEQRLIYEGLLQNVGTSVKQSDLPTFEQYYNETYEEYKETYEE
jgi:hypothetical protein